MEGLELRKAVGLRFGTRIAKGDAVFLSGAGRIAGLPCTVSNGKRRSLSGMNRFMLLQVMKDQGWTDPRFFTADQIKKEGWAISEGAKQVGLQFLVVNGPDGLPLEAPETKLFHVFNAGQIGGVSAVEAEPLASASNLEQAALEAGFSISEGGIRAAVTGWLGSLQDDLIADGQAGKALRVHLAAALLEVQTELPTQDGGGGEFVTAWAQGIESNPLSFFQAVKDAEDMAAVVMAQVKSLEAVRQFETEIAAANSATAAEQQMSNGERTMEGSKPSSTARMDALFNDRAAVLAVPFADKERAKSAGAMWYATESVWFVPAGVDLGRFKDWNPNLNFLGQEATRDLFIREFSDSMLHWGLELPTEILADEKWHNVQVTTSSKKNKKGAYLLDLRGEPKGVIRNMHTGMVVPWTYQGELLTPEARAKMRQKALKLDVEKKQERALAQDVAAEHAIEIVALGQPAEQHGYVIKKGISSEGLFEVTGEILLRYPEFIGENGYSAIRPKEYYLIVPMCNAAGDIRAVQAINEDGSVKSFMRGGQKQGTMFVLGAKSFDSLCSKPSTAAIAYVEGVATGDSFRSAAGTPTVVCFDAGNLQTVVAETAAKVPHSVLPILAVDNDQFHVERALGFMADHVGINPHAQSGDVVYVQSRANGLRAVSMGDVVADGEWHQTPFGTYSVMLDRDGVTGAVQSVSVEMVPDDDGRKVQAKFVNTGIEAGKAALKAFAVNGGQLRAVMAIPEFVSTKNRPTDWNDLAQSEGIEAIRTVLRSVDGIAARAKQQAQEQHPGVVAVRAKVELSR